MTSPAPLIQRLQTHQVNARRMLAPGLKDSARQQRSLAPVLDAWGGQKYANMARGMRFLSGERLGQFTPEKINLIGRDLPARFSDPASLLHVRPPTARENSIWSDVEKVLPAAGSSAEAQSPVEPGTLRQGSVIQRLQTFPKPGQSIESFKEQVQSRAVTTKPASAPAPRPRPKPGEPVRRYSRIEEMTGKEPPAPAEPPALPPDTIQRQLEPAPRLKSDAPEPPRAAPEPLEASPSAEPLRADSPDSQPPEPTPVQAAKPPAAASVELPNAASPDRPDLHPALAMPVKALPAPKQRQERAVPKSEAPSATVKLAQPVARHQTRTSRRPEAQLPRAMPAPAPKESAPAPKTPSLSRVTSRPEQAAARFTRSAPKPPAPLAAATIQRQEEPNEVPQAQPTSEAASPAVRAETPAKTTSTQVEATLRPETLPDLPRPPEAPLLLHLAQRKAAPEQIRFVTPKVVKPDAQRPALIQRNLPRLGPRPPAQAAPPPAMPGRDRGLPVRPPAQPIANEGATVPPPAWQGTAPFAAQSKVDMPVARIAEKAAPQARMNLPADGKPAVAPPAPNNQPLSPAAPAAPVAASSAASNVVQRLWEGHSPPASQSGGSTGSAAESGAESGAGLDLDTLAEQVFPIVKRLIEIESERSSGYLR